jgi:hypothetical protein
MPKVSKATIYFPDRAPVRVAVEEVKLKSSSEDAWNVLIDNPGWVHWYQGVTSCEDMSTTKGVVGATRRMVSGLQADEEFIALEPMRVRALLYTRPT